MSEPDTPRLFLLDGMALVYRAHFAFLRRPILNSRGENVSALFGFTNTLVDILTRLQPTHIAIAMDTEEPTQRHEEFPDYKAQREEIPEDIASALPALDRLARAFRVPILRYPGYEADDIVGSLAQMAEERGWETFMVTPDKDFAQLVTQKTRLYRPGRGGGDAEIWGVDEVRQKWGIDRPQQVPDVLGLWGDSSDNIPGVPGFGEKTAKKLIGRYGSVEALLEHVDDLKGKQKERLAENKERALLSKKLSTIDRHVPIREDPDDLRFTGWDEDALSSFFTEYEFNALGQRLFGEAFKAGRGQAVQKVESTGAQEEMFLADLRTLKDVAHDYRRVTDREQCKVLIRELARQESFCFDVETDSLDPKRANIVGISFATEAHSATFVPFPNDPGAAAELLQSFRPLFEGQETGKTGHHLKYDISVLKWHGVDVRGPLFDTMLAHFLIEPDQRHSMDYLAERYLGYTPIPLTALIGEKKSAQVSLWEVAPERLTDYAAEDADVTLQLRQVLEPLLAEYGQERVFYEIECPLVRVLAAMEYEGVALDVAALEAFAAELTTSMGLLEKRIFELAGCEFNLNSPKQLGEVLFDQLKLIEKAKKTRTGQYATSEPVLMSLAPKHEIVRLILDYRALTKLKGTYVDALPGTVHEKTRRVHTTFHQTAASTGRLASSDPNLQNIPIRTEHGQQIRRAFVPRGSAYRLLSADYSQIELRLMAEMSGDHGLKEAFLAGHDIHVATAARVYGLDLGDVDGEMRRTAKMVNFGIIYGISAFGLAQRLGIPKGEAAAIIEQYFLEYPGVKAFMQRTIASCREKGYVETMTGRRRYIRDIQSANQTTRNAAERMAINAPLQGTAADMIKMAMNRIHERLREGNFETRMILQVHDELVFDMHRSEEETVKPFIEEDMKAALPLSIPVVVEMGVGDNWLEAH